MMRAVADSGPCIHLSILKQIDLLPRYFHPLLTLPQVYDEVVTHGSGRPGADELAAACERGQVQRIDINDPHILEHVRQMPSDMPAANPAMTSVTSVCTLADLTDR